MANSAAELSTPPFATSDVRGDTHPQQHLTSPGPLRRADLDPLTPSPLSRPHRLQPLELVPETEGRRKGTKKKKKKRRREEGEGEEQRGKRLVGNNCGPAPSRDLQSGDAGREVEEGSAPKLDSPLDSPPDPLLGKSTFQQLQARLDPLYTVPPSQNADPYALQSDADTEAVGNGDKRAKEEIEREEEEASVDLMHNLGHGDRKDGDKQRRESRKRRKPGNSKRKRTRRESRGQEEEAAIERPETNTNELMHPPEPSEIASVIASEIAPENKEDSEDFITSQLLQLDSERQALEYYPPPEEIQEQDREDESPEDYVSYPLPTSSSTQRRDVIFIERRDGGGFIVQQRRKGEGYGDDGGLESGGGWVDREISSAEFALLSHRFVQNIGLIAHGLLAGLSLWDGVVSNVLSHQTDLHLTLVQHYHSLVLPAHSLYLTLLSLVCLSLLDRLDLARLNKNCWKFTFHSLTGIIILLASLLMFIALLVSLSLAATDERISLYPDQPALWPDLVTTLNLTTLSSTTTIPPTTHPSTNNTNNFVAYVAADHPMTSRLTSWLILSLLRSTCCVLGWGLMVWVSHHDRLKEHLMEIAGTSANIPLLTSNKLQPVNNGPQPTDNGPQLTDNGPQPTNNGPHPTYNGSQPTYNGPQPTYNGPHPTYNGSQPTYNGPQPTYNGLQHQTSTNFQEPLSATNRPLPTTNRLLSATNRPLHSTGQHFPTTSTHTPFQPPVHHHQPPVDHLQSPVHHVQPPADHFQPPADQQPPVGH